MRKNNIYLDGIMGLVVGDAVGVPYEFKSRKTMKLYPATGMIGYGTHYQSKGTWSDDSSMTIATLESLKYNESLDEMMYRFNDWYRNGEYTATGVMFDIGGTTARAINNYGKHKNIFTCGETSINSNGNGSLMRILPACIYCFKKYRRGAEETELVNYIHRVSSLTHAHMISKMACGFYYFMVKNIILRGIDGIRDGIDQAFEFYKGYKELKEFRRLENVKEFAKTEEKHIRSGGYVLDSLEASIWCLLNTKTYKDCILKAVNLGSDTDTTAAITGGLAGIVYGYNGIPKTWVNNIKKKNNIIRLCKMEADF